MIIHIHRGQNQIGGSIIEISTTKTRLFFDIGINLTENEDIEVPQIEGLFCGEKNCDGVLISHYHSDHMGLIPSLLDGIPIYMGERAYDVFKASADYRDISVDFLPSFVYDKKEFFIGDISVTPYLCDHSSFDLYMYIIKADKKSLLYTGDYRANGRLNFEEILNSLPKVDAIITEGTSLTRETEKHNIEEEKLEKIATDYLSKCSGPAFIMMSSMNVDRITTAHNIANNTHRIFLEDLYTADISSSAGLDIFDNARVFMTGGDKQYQKLKKYKDIKISKYEIAKISFVMCIRQSMKNYLEKLNELVSFENGVLFYGMWKGYMEQTDMKEFLRFMEIKGVKIHILHTSGHADLFSIERLIKAVRPHYIIPVHTEKAKWFEKFESSHTIYESTIEL